MKEVLTQDQFYSKASELRKFFESRFQDPRSGGGERFVWDHWFVKDQYRLIRTPAYHYFPEKMYRAFHEALVNWGRENLGCHDISPPWLSYYVDGCRQSLHADVPHGPWAFVFSLSPVRKKYEGGETMILRAETLNYWPHFHEVGREQESFVRKVPSPFNRLTVFDPRFPHGVSEVRGVEDPLEARLVIHGWFVEPRPYVVGALTTTQVSRALDPLFQSLQGHLDQIGNGHGTLSVRLFVQPSGIVGRQQILTDTLVGLEAGEAQVRVLKKALQKLFADSRFPVKKTSSKITVPLLFKS